MNLIIGIKQKNIKTYISSCVIEKNVKDVFKNYTNVKNVITLKNYSIVFT